MLKQYKIKYTQISPFFEFKWSEEVDLSLNYSWEMNRL